MKRWTVAIVAGIASLGSGAACAGQQFDAVVQISTANRDASGALGAARHSADARQLIGCHVTYSTISVSKQASVYCEADDASGQRAFCSSSDPKLVEVARSISAYSHVRFLWDASGFCTQLTVRNFSDTLP